MNPVLLKPQSEIGAQLVVQGKVYGRASAADYQAIKPELMPFVLDSFARLKGEADLVLVEGAGSASEINLRANDIANMGFARAADVPVVLIGDIDRGGVIASLVGTKAVIDADDAALIEGFLVNKFRGDPALFANGMALIAAATGWAAARPHPLLRRRAAAAGRGCAGARCSAARQSRSGASRSRCRCCRTSPISTISIRSTPSRRVELVRVRPGNALPGRCRSRHPAGLQGDHRRSRGAARKRASTSTSSRISAAAARVLGLCGGYQMLGRAVHDPDGIEGPPGTAAGLGLLDVETMLAAEKRLEKVAGTTRSTARPSRATRCIWALTEGPDCARPFARLADGSAGRRDVGRQAA